MAAENRKTMMHSGPRVPIQDLGQCIICPLCKGYFIDATTIVECLHTFCRSCIVKYLEKNKYCPVCDVQVHKTKPLLNLRTDTTIQNLIYKLVPRLYHDEMKRRKVYYDTHPEVKPTLFELNVEELYQNLLTPEETLCLTLSYNGCETSARYFRCPSAVNVAHIKRLIRAKYDLSELHRVEVLYNQDCLSPDLSLMDVAYIYSWKRNTPLELTYKIYECRPKKPKLDSKETLDSSHFNHADTSNNNNWKEVQLRISESGEISVTGIQDDSLLTLLETAENFKQDVIINESTKLQDKETTNSEEIKVPEKKIKAPKKPKTPSKEKKLNSKKDPKQKNVQNNVSPTKRELPGLKLINKPINDTQNKTVTSGTTANSLASKESNSIGSSVTDTINKVLGNSQLTLTSKTVELKPNENTAVVSVPTTLSLGAVKTVFTTINSSKCSTKLEEPAKKKETKAPESPIAAVTVTKPEHNLKRKNENQICDVPLKVPKPTILNHSLGLISNLSNNHPLKKHSKLNRNGEHPKSLEAFDKNLSSSASITANCVSTVAKADFPTKPIILNQNIGQGHQGVLGKHPGITVPSYAPKSFYSPSVDSPSRSNPAINEEGKVGTSTSKTEVSLLSALTSSVPSQLSVSLTNNTAPAFTHHNSISAPPHGTPPFLLNSAIGTALKHPGITTFSTHLTPSTGFNHSSYMPPPPPVQITPQTTKSSLPPPPATPQPVKTLIPPPPCSTASQPTQKSKPATPLGYKTLRDPPKSWNAQIAKANLNVQKTAAANQAIAAAAVGAGNSNQPPGGKYADLKSVRPAKFFKLRNMPRYLGNPASGVKPMFPVQTCLDKGKEQKNTSNPAPAKTEKSSEIKKHSIVKIDPKTLKPISEKAPETSNLSNLSSCLSISTSQQQHNSQEQRVPSTMLDKNLRINTSSVSIFNPLKLQQNSPKGDRKSPKSPHSPKPRSSTGSASSLTMTTSSSSTPTPAVSVPLSPTNVKRDQKQSNLTFTPPNPFVPNMAAQALSPNQFLFPTGAPPGFPTYDPRVMAAYHSLWYSQRLAAAGFHGAFPGAAAGLAGLGNLGLPPSNSVSHQQQQHSPGVPLKHNTPSKPTQCRNSSSSSTSGTTSKSPVSKKSQLNLTTKSLETALEKLTQNKVKELGSKNEKPSPSNKETLTNAATSTILPPVVPNVESVGKTPIEKVPVEHKMTSDKQKPLDKQNITEKTRLEVAGEMPSPKNRIEPEKKELKTSEPSPENTRGQSKTDKDVKECNNPTKTEDKIAEKNLITLKAEEDKQLIIPKETSTVTFSNILSLTNAIEDKNVQTKDKESVATLAESSVTDSSSNRTATLNVVTDPATVTISEKCDMSNNGDKDNVLKTVGTNGNCKNDDEMNVKSKDTEKSGNVQNITDTINETKTSNDIINKSNVIEENKNEKITTKTSQSEGRSENNEVAEKNEIKKDSATSVSETERDTNEKSEVKRQANVVADENSKRLG